jgi:DNA processing protein
VAARAAAGLAASSGRVPDEAEREALAVLVSVPGIGPATLARLIGAIGSAREVVDLARRPGARARLTAAAPSRGDRPGGVNGEIAHAIIDAAGRTDEIVGRVRAAGLTVVTLDDESYPPRLRATELPPLALFVRGSVEALSSRRAVAMVGTRSATAHGRQVASQLAALLSAAGATVVSGLAIGIDGAAHAGVVAIHGATVAVLGGGHDRLYPVAHARLARTIAEEGGAVISEHAPGTSPTRYTFPRRNRIIAGLAEATIVVEAGRGSGALTTAVWAMEQGRGCFVVPGAIGAPTWAGCLELLRECHGVARIVAGPAELLMDLDLPDDLAKEGESGRLPGSGGVPTVAAVLLELGPTARSVGRALVAGLATPDDLVAATDLPIATVLASLTVLEGRGLATSAYGRYRAAGALAAALPRGRRTAPVPRVGGHRAS